MKTNKYKQNQRFYKHLDQACCDAIDKMMAQVMRLRSNLGTRPGTEKYDKWKAKVIALEYASTALDVVRRRGTCLDMAADGHPKTPSTVEQDFAEVKKLERWFEASIRQMKASREERQSRN